MNTKKEVYLEILRIIAICFVIFNHTGLNGYWLFTQRTPDTLSFYIYLFLSLFCKFAVPLFMAISGAVLLGGKDEPVKKNEQRIFRIVTVLVVYSFLYYLQSIYLGECAFSWRDYVVSLIAGNISAHLWYLYLYLAFLISLPILRRLAQNLDDKMFVYMIILAVVFNGVIPCFEYTLGFTLNANAKVTWIGTNIVLCPCVGYYLHTMWDHARIKKVLPIIWIINLLALIAEEILTIHCGIQTNEWKGEIYHNRFAIVNAIAIWMTVKCYLEKVNWGQRVQSVVLSVGKSTFGIYLIHVLLMRTNIYTKLFMYMRGNGMNAMVAVILMCFLVLCISYFITMVMSKLWGVKKLV